MNDSDHIIAERVVADGTCIHGDPICADCLGALMNTYEDVRAERDRLHGIIDALNERLETYKSAGKPHVDAVVERVEALIDERDRLARLAVHCDRCVGDYAATGLETGRPCLIMAGRDLLQREEGGE